MDQVLTFFGRESNTAGNYTGHILSFVRIRGGRIFAAWFVHGMTYKNSKSRVLPFRASKDFYLVFLHSPQGEGVIQDVCGTMPV